MKWMAGLAAAIATGVGLMILIKVGDVLWVSGVRSYTTPTGDTVWIPTGRDGYTTMIYLAPLFLLYPIIGLASSRRRR